MRGVFLLAVALAAIVAVTPVAVLAAPVRIVFVDTGNTGRSLAAEQLSRRLIARRHLEIAVISRGVDVDPFDDAPETWVSALLRRRGIVVADHRAEPLDVSAVRHADLILTMTAAHKAAVIAAWPDARAKTFTLAAFAGQGGDVADAWGRPRQAYEAMIRQLDALLPGALEHAAQIPPTTR